MNQFFLAAFAAVLLMPCSASAVGSKKAGVAVVQAWARATPAKAKVGAAYITLKSTGESGDRLTGVTSPVASRVEVHSHITEDGLMKMRKIDNLEIGAGKTVTFKPGGYHLMMFDLSQPLKEGENLELSLTFEKAGKVDVSAKILPIWSLGPDEAAGKPASTSGGDDMRHHHH